MWLFIAIISGPIGLESIIVQYIDWTLDLKPEAVTFTSDCFYFEFISSDLPTHTHTT